MHRGPEVKTRNRLAIALSVYRHHFVLSERWHLVDVDVRTPHAELDLVWCRDDGVIMADEIKSGAMTGSGMRRLEEQLARQLIDGPKVYGGPFKRCPRGAAAGARRLTLLRYRRLDRVREHDGLLGRDDVTQYLTPRRLERLANAERRRTRQWYLDHALEDVRRHGYLRKSMRAWLVHPAGNR